MDLQCGCAVFQRIIHGDGLPGKLALLADQNHGLVQVIGNGSTEDKTSGLSAYHYIKIHILYQILHGIDGQFQAVSILCHSGNVPEHDPFLRKIRDGAYIIF